MAPHSSTLAWKIPWMEEPGRLQSMGLLRVRHDWATSLWLFTFMHWRRKWQPAPMSLPGESQGQGSLVGCRLWGRTESDTTEAAAAARDVWAGGVWIPEWLMGRPDDLRGNSKCRRSERKWAWCVEGREGGPEWAVLLEREREGWAEGAQAGRVHTAEPRGPFDLILSKSGSY